MQKEKVIQEILKEKVIVIVRGLSREELIPFAEAVYAGGIRFLEITYDAAGAIPDEETADRIRMLAEYFAGRMYIGAGTVLSPEQVQLTRTAGGSFIISPDSCPDVIRETVSAGLVSIPGAFTPTEIAEAHRLGADFVKVFPAGSLGPDYIKALHAPLSHVRMLAVGGVNTGNMKDYTAAGACGFGIGSDIVDKKSIAAGDFEAITARAKKYTDIISGT